MKCSCLACIVQDGLIALRRLPSDPKTIVDRMDIEATLHQAAGWARSHSAHCPAQSVDCRSGANREASAVPPMAVYGDGDLATAGEPAGGTT